MLDRVNVPEQYKWKFEGFDTDQEIEKVFKTIEKLTKIIPTYSGKLGDEKMLYELLNKYEKDEILIEKFAHYMHNMINVDCANTKFLKLRTRFFNAYNKYSEAAAYITPQLNKLPLNYLQGLIKNPKFKNYTTTIENVIHYKPHRVDEKTNLILTKLDSVIGDNTTVYDIFTDSEMPFDEAADSKGKKHKVYNSNYASFMNSEDRVLRKNAFDSMMNGYGNFIKTFERLYLKDIETDKILAKMHNYPSCLDEALDGEFIPRAVFDKVISETNKQIPLLQEYIKTRAKVEGLKDFSIYDLFHEGKKFSKKVTIESMKDLVKAALAPLGDEYIALLEKKFNDQSIDYLPNKNKTSGAYSSSCFGGKNVVLMNFTGNFEDISTLAHEMGHCINGEYYNSAQNHTNAGIYIFTAEIASTVNEILLNNYMMNNCTENQKEFFIKQYLERVRSTIFRQVLFSEFELWAHTQIENETPITYVELCDKYYELNKKYYGNSLVVPKNFKYEWARIPHFYNAYYVYCYATGLITAINIVENINANPNYVKKYIHFLKNGTKVHPIEILKEIDIDLTTDAPYEKAFNSFKNYIKMYKNVTKIAKK